MVRGAADFSDKPETRVRCIQLLTRLINMCDIGLQGLAPDSSTYVDLCYLRRLCVRGFPVSLIWEEVVYVSKKVQKACSDAVPNFVVFSISSTVEGGIYINIGCHTIRALDNLRVNHPVLQMVLLAEHFGGEFFACLKSMTPKSILHMAKTSGSFASPTECIADWISANWKSGSPNAVRNNPCGIKKPLLPVLFNISAMKKTSSTVSVIPQSGDNVKCGPYDSPMTVAEGSQATLKICPQSVKRIEVDPQHLRKNGFASIDDTFIHMIEGPHGTNADRSMLYVNILDSGSPHHCTGDSSQFSEYLEGVAPVPYLRGAGGTQMRVHGTGSIHNENFQVNGVLYVPGLNNQPNINKTLFSVGKLNDLGFSVVFNPDETASVIDNRKRTWKLEHEIVGKARKIHGQFMLDYLRIPPNRDPVPMLEGPGLLKKLRNVSLSVWSSITGLLSQRTTRAQRPPV